MTIASPPDAMDGHRFAGLLAAFGFTGATGFTIGVVEKIGFSTLLAAAVSAANTTGAAGAASDVLYRCAKITRSLKSTFPS